MATYKLSIDDFDEPEYVLLAIHTPLEDYRLAFALNRALQLKLEWADAGVRVKNKSGEALFSRYSYKNPDGIIWELLQNKTELSESTDSGQDLFGNPVAGVSSRTYLMPEFKKVDYFLKIDADGETDHEDTAEAISKIAQIAMTYPIKDNLVKSRNNLIFLEHANKQKNQDRSHAWAGL